MQNQQIVFGEINQLRYITKILKNCEFKVQTQLRILIESYFVFALQYIK